jgi:hypothetical protein
MLKKTLEVIHQGNGKYSGYMSGDVSYKKPSIRFRPGFGWIYLQNSDLNYRYSIGFSSYWPFFEHDNFTRFTTVLLAK